MQEDRIKSAREIAMERLASMPALTPEELNEQREKEYGPRGTGIAARYLDGALRDSDLEGELRRYQGKEGEVVRKAFISTLCASISLRNEAKGVKAIEGIAVVAGGADLGEMKREVTAIAGELRHQEEQRRAAYEDRERQKLARLGISGSAVRPNVAASEEWQEELAGIESGYRERIESIGEALRRATGV